MRRVLRSAALADGIRCRRPSTLRVRNVARANSAVGSRTTNATTTGRSGIVPEPWMWSLSQHPRRCPESPRAGPDQRWCPPNDWGRNASWWYWQYRRMDSQRPTPEARQRDAILRASRGLNCVLSPSIWSHRSNGRSVGCKTALTRDQPLGLRSRPRSHRTLNIVCILQPSVRPGKH